jgi:cytochrome d ubiquinol oxidase subunit I
MEGDFETERDAPEILFGIPNMKEQRTDYEIAMPYLGSLILTHSLDGEVLGLKHWPRADQPYSPLIFFTFRIMVSLGFLMAGIGLISLWLRRGRRLYRALWLQRTMVAMAPAGFIALVCGWITTEVGRQPYTVYGLLRTSDSVSPIGLPGVATSLALFVVVYLVVYAAGVAFLLRLMARPPHPGEQGPAQGAPIHAAGLTPGPAAGAPRPLAAGE